MNRVSDRESIQVKKGRSLMKIFLAGMLLVLMVSCSSDDSAKEEQSAIDRAVQKTADKAVRYIKEPINKAEAVKTVEEERTRKLEEQVQ